jgi:hypothetical protein
VAIVGSFILWLIVNHSWPGFFDPFQYWWLTDNLAIAVAQSWPFYVYEIIITIVVLKRAENDFFIIYYNTVSFKDIYRSVMAGILEEIGFRCIFIFTSMIPIALMELVFPGVIMWWYKNIFFPFTDIITLRLMHNTIYGHPTIFMAGALSANAAFRNGHKYQGSFGVFSAWFAGLYLLQIMLTKGLIVAILAHMICDLTINFTRYFYIKNFYNRVDKFLQSYIRDKTKLNFLER